MGLVRDESLEAFGLGNGCDDSAGLCLGGEMVIGGTRHAFGWESKLWCMIGYGRLQKEGLEKEDTLWERGLEIVKSLGSSSASLLSACV